VSTPPIPSSPRVREPVDVQKILRASRVEPSVFHLEWLMVDESSSFLFAISNGGIRGFELSTGRGQLGRLASRWGSSFAQGAVRGVTDAIRTADPKEEERVSQELHAAAFGPLADELAKKPWSRIVLA